MRFEEPESVVAAQQLLAADPWGAQAVSGGTAVVLMMRQGLIAPDSLISLARIPELRGIARREDGGASVVRIGASTTLREVATSPLVRAHAPALATACSVVGNPRIRNVATLGGNLAEADYASDPPAALAALGATVGLAGPDGERAVPAGDFITGFYETVITEAELVTHVDVPVEPHRRETYLKYRSRSSEDRACVGVCACVSLGSGVVQDLDVVVGAVASTPQRVPDVLAETRGQGLDERVASRVADAYAATISPMDDARGSAWYRRRMIAVFVRRALLELALQTSAGEGPA